MVSPTPFAQSPGFPFCWSRPALLSLLLLAGCDVQSLGGDTGGLGGGPGGLGGSAGEQAPGDCPTGVTVLLSDFLSTQIALSSLQGETLSASLLSTASTTTDGLAFALSGDVTLPGTRPASGRVVLLDRYGTNVISWVDPRSGEVLDQLPVGTGFEANPQDYLEIDRTTAWVSRWGQNASPGAEPFDDGGDVLRIDLERTAIVDSLVMAPDDGLPARPGPMALVDDEVFVTLARIARDFSATGEAELRSFRASSGAPLVQQRLHGRKNCGRLTASPDGSILALACSGALNPDGEVEDLAQSALLLFDGRQRPLRTIATFEAEDLLGEPIQAAVAFADDTTLLLKTQTPLLGPTNNRLFALDWTNGITKVLLEASPDRKGLGKGIVYHDVVCAPGCSDTCLMADSDRGQLQHIGQTDDGWAVLSASAVENEVGLAPVGLCGR